MGTDLKGRRVLVVDDFANMRTTLKHMLEAVGIRDIEMAANGREAVGKIERGDFDVVLCDYNLGEGKDGQQVLEEVKHRGLIRHSTIFVMITAENTMNMVMGAMEYRPDDYLTKPFTKDLLRRRLERQVARKADFQTIERAIQNKDLLKAIELCDGRIAEQPKNVNEFLRLKGELCLEVQDYDQAEQVFRQALERRNLPWAMVGLGKIQYQRGDYPAARDTFQAAIAEHKAYMEAHDWLARTLLRMGEGQAAQDVLNEAVAMSPKAVLRQRTLGEVAAGNEDHETAERAYRRTVTLGKESVFRSPSDYAGLAQAQVRNDGSPLEVAKTLNAMRQDFKGDQAATLEAAVAESSVYREMGREDEARKAFEEAVALYETVGGEASTQVALGMAEACLAFGDRERGMAIMEHVVSNHHDDEAVLGKAQGVFDKVGMREEGEKAILASQQEVKQRNNQGVSLVREGRLEEAVALFDEVVGKLPFNTTANLNAAQARLMHMKQNGAEKEALSRARRYLECVRRSDPQNANLHKLWSLYERLAG